MKLQYYIKAMRLRTLPLSLGGVSLGVLLAAAGHPVQAGTVLSLILTTLSLQILSNISNELGDFLRGTDTEDRQGPEYGLASGKLSVHGIRVQMWIFVGLCMVFGLSMIRLSQGTLFSATSLGLTVLGAAAIWAAMHYTLGRNPYGYRGLGDLFVFLFFGLVAVIGAYFITAGTLDSGLLLLPAAAVGAFSVAVLNVNNIRDLKTDAGKRTTVALQLGERRAKTYQTCLIAGGWICMLAYSLLQPFNLWHFLYLPTLPLYLKHLQLVRTRSDRGLDPALPLLTLSTLLFCLLAGLGFLAA